MEKPSREDRCGDVGGNLQPLQKAKRVGGIVVAEGQSQRWVGGGTGCLERGDG